MTVADQIVDWLIQKGISHAFGIVGAGILPIFEAVAKKKEITLVCCHHEQAAVMASSFFNRTSGILKSVALCTTGAGSSNALTGVLAAWMDSVPLMVISGNEPSYFFDRSHPRVIGVQGYSSASMASHITKFSLRVSDNPIPAFESAYEIATAERMGPVWLDCPRDITARETPCN